MGGAAPIHTNLILDPSPNDGLTVTAAFVSLARWYAAHSAVRRLWAIKDSQRMSVIVTLEPTHDGDDIYPAWLANGHEWAHELQLLMDGPVQLEVMDEPFLGEFAAGVDGVLVAELFCGLSAHKAPKRDRLGRFLPGRSGNPAGRPRDMDAGAASSRLMWCISVGGLEQHA